MAREKNNSIGRKLTLIILTISAISTIASCLFFGAYDWATNRRTMADDLTTLADLLGNNSTAALIFRDKTTAEELLKGLRAHPHIRAAALFADDRTLFASYTAPGASLSREHLHVSRSPSFSRTRLIVCRPIVLDNKPIGAVHLEAGMDRLYERVKIYAVVSILIVLASVIITFILATMLRRLITTPILNLAAVARQVSEHKDYSVRAVKVSEDEIGELTDGFNRMLHGIETRDSALRQSNEALHREIAERRKAEEGLRLLNETLEQRVSERTAAAETASHTKSEFLANVSHELRTPLNSVIGFANLLLKNKAGNLRPDDLAYLERVQANGRHLLALINQVLDLSKIEAQKAELDLVPVDLAALVRNVLDETEAQVYGKPVTLRLDAPPATTPFRTDPGRLRQVLLNLIGNGVKFTDRGHVLVSIVTEPRTNYPIRIDVSDTGIGIPDDKQSVIFQAFKQADSTTARKYGGTGLGLTISLALCQLMGYGLTVCSEPGRGSTFSILLSSDDGIASGLGKVPPLEAVPRTAAVHEPPADPLEGRVILVVDDEEDALLMLTRMIEDFGCIVLPASSGEEALRLARKSQPDAITLDLLMPGTDGWAVLKELKGDPVLQDIPVVVISVVAEEQRGTIIGALDVLPKPINRDNLIRVLKRSQQASILIVDDSEDDRRLIAACLEDDATTVLSATSGSEALSLLGREKPDLVILDLMMPGMDGETFLRVLRETKEHSSLPVVVLTSRDLTAQERRHLSGMASAVLHKSENLSDDLRPILASILRPESRGRRNGKKE